MTKHDKLIDGVVVDLDLDHAIDLDALEAIADWKEDLRARIRCAQLRLELAGLEPERVDEFVEEVAAFKKCCRCLAWRPEVA